MKYRVKFFWAEDDFWFSQELRTLTAAQRLRTNGPRTGIAPQIVDEHGEVVA